MSGLNLHRIKRPNGSPTTTNINDPSWQREQERFTTILGGFLEILTHELLYLRSAYLYPRDAFSPTRYYGVACHACRHPDVVKYIYDTLRVATPAIISGHADSLYLILYDSSTDELFERFVLQWSMEDTIHITNDNTIGNGGGGRTKEKNNNPSAQSRLSEVELLDHKVQQLERALRDVLLKVISLHGRDLSRRKKDGNDTSTGQKKKSNTTSVSSTTTFKLCLHTVDSEDGENGNDNTTSSSAGNLDSSSLSQGATGNASSGNSTRPCPELENAMKEGRWMRSDSSQFNSIRARIVERSTMDDDDFGDENEDNDFLTRPLKSIHVPSCGLQMIVSMEVPR